MNSQSTISDGREKNTSFVTPNDIINNLSLDKNYCLFLDIDGTLAPFQINPEHSFIPQTTLDVIKKITKLNIPVIAVTGRDVDTASKLLHPIEVPIAGLHGLDIYFDSGNYIRPDLSSINFKNLKQDITKNCDKYPELLVEDKGYSIALHYRKNPNLENNAINIMQKINLNYPQLKINRGKFVVELIPKQADKGRAIKTILNHLDLPTVLPIFIGDDLTDEVGFTYINQQSGLSIKVGPGETQAKYRLKDIDSVSAFLLLFQNKIKSLYVKNSQNQNGEKLCLN
ncbi:trehalose-phosphatase [Acinetobacter sp. 1542444]|uniref:trehalose-phosphatase n=1 Tax=Acinetobacter calcoaceticus/baumannii complex TaxID=909768 RepID=UPI00044B2D84|nr:MULTISPECIES: trehalose-phosphatase [Acinetobacter calcoaceticus/baumannii complex]EXE62471.1 trehalose-phosphatase [Acinetobacter sp. 1542444]KIE87055.1 trehalose phosphatase [Acinetobacter pittii]